MRGTATLLAVAALAAPATALAGLPVSPTGSALGEGLPLKAYATVTPSVHLFGDAVTARLAVVADTKLVDPARLRVRASFAPYRPVRRPTVLRVHAGRFEQVTWIWTLRCLTAPCVPVKPPSEKYHVFHFRLARIDYLARDGKRAYGITASWPAVEVLSQVSPGVVAFLAKTKRLDWRYSLAPLPPPAYAVSPRLVFWAALVAAGLLAAAALALVRRRYLAAGAHGAAGASSGRSTLERALAFLAWAHERGDETLQRKAFERVADELEPEDELTRAARELAWSPRTPAAEEVAGFAEQVRESAEDEEQE